MKTLHPFRFSAELFKRGGGALGQVPVAPDWEPAAEAARFSAQRKLGLAAIGADAVLEFRPCWHATLGEPYLNAVEAVLTMAGSDPVSCKVPTAYFQPLATAASAQLVKKGLLQSGESFEYLVTAYPNPASEPPSGVRSSFAVEEVPVPLEVKSSNLDDFILHSTECGVSDPEDIPVFIPRSVLAETEALARQSPAIEVASVLIGHLHRDQTGRDLFLEITAQIPARNSQGTALKVTFGPDTYQAVQSAIALRGASEQWAGWFHSHPASAWCNPQCPPEARANCRLQRTFFSADDCDVHRTLFPKAFSIALLATITDAGLQFALFSWRQGVIVQRGFRALGDEQQPPAPAAGMAVATIGDNTNEIPCAS